MSSQFPGQNTNPGQGGQPYPQGGQPYPQQGQPYPQGGQPYPPGGQPYPQGGQPYPQQGQPYPAQQGGQFPQGQPYPQQGGQFPQKGGPFPQGQQPAGYTPSGGQYPPVGGQFGQPPTGGQPGYQGGGGFRPQPPKPKSNGMIIGVVLAGLVAVALAGWLLMSLFGSTSDPSVVPSVQPSPAVSSVAPTLGPSPSTSTDPDPSPSASPSTSTNTPSGSLEVGLRVSVVPADGWQQSSRDEIKNYTELSNGKALLATQAFQVQGSVTGKDIVAAYMKQITDTMTGVTTKDPAVMDVKNNRLSVGIGSWAGTRATSQGSVKLQYLTIISVRDDGLAVMSTLIVPSGSTVAAQQADYLAMTNSLLSSQLKA